MITTLDLLNMSEADLAKLTKAELIAAIKSNAYSVKADLSQVEKLKEAAANRHSEHNIAIRMCAGFLGDDLLPEESYRGWDGVEYHKQDLPTLLARVFSRTVEEARRS